MKEIEGNKAVIYKITNSVNGKFYIGSSSKYNKRKKRHFETLKNNSHHCKPLQRAVNKYGIDKFQIDILELFPYIDVRDILAKEQAYLDTLNPQYNVCRTAGSQLGSKRDLEFKKKCSERMVGTAAWNKGLILPSQSIETKNRRSKSMMGKIQSKATIDKIRRAVSKPVLQIDKNGNFIKEWINLKTVSKELPCSHGRISQYVNGKSNISTFKGFVWKLKKTA